MNTTVIPTRSTADPSQGRYMRCAKNMRQTRDLFRNMYRNATSGKWNNIKYETADVLIVMDRAATCDKLAKFINSIRIASAGSQDKGRYATAVPATARTALNRVVHEKDTFALILVEVRADDNANGAESASSAEQFIKSVRQSGYTNPVFVVADCGLICSVNGLVPFQVEGADGVFVTGIGALKEDVLDFLCHFARRRFGEIEEAKEQ